ncbi:hypothetical protein lerEdw1_020352 [Lerista edwardsae]|nr:hypothetical protein lerEdw1_020352 [Lerista edwardsae]
MLASVSSHVSRVRALYRKILQLHRGLPLEMKALGDQYVKEEFRRHKSIGREEAQCFLQEWEASVLTAPLTVQDLCAVPMPISAISLCLVPLLGDKEIAFLYSFALTKASIRVTPAYPTSSAQNYAAMLWQQTSQNVPNTTSRPHFGSHLPEEKLNALRDEQIGQLLELMQEATKPKTQFNISDDKDFKS